MALPEHWIEILNKKPENIRYHEDWVIVRICSDDNGKTIYPLMYNEVQEGTMCYPYYILAKPTHSGDLQPKSKFAKNPKEGDVFRGVFGNYRVVHVWNNRIELTQDMVGYAAKEADRLSIKKTIMEGQKKP